MSNLDRLTYYLAEEIAELFGWGCEVDGGRYDFLPDFIKDLIIKHQQDNPMTDIIDDTSDTSTARKAALAIIGDLGDRSGFDFDNIDAEVMTEIEDTLTNLVEQSVGAGPYTLDVAANLNQIHAAAVEQDAGYSVSYQPTVKEFTVQSLGQKLTHHVATSDNLFVAVQQAREKLGS